MEALKENARTEPPMVQKDDVAQLLLQILNNQDGKDEEVGTNCQGSGQQPQIEVDGATKSGPPFQPSGKTKDRATKSGPRVEQPRVEPPRMEQPRFEPPRVDPPQFEHPRVEPPRMEPPRFEPPRMEPPRFEPPRMDPSRFEQPRMEPPRMEQPWFEQPRMEPPRFEQPSMEPPRFEQPRMKPPRFEPRMEPPWMGPPQFGFPRAEPYQGQPEVAKEGCQDVPYRKPYPERIDREEWPRGFKAKPLPGMPYYRQILLSSWEEMEEKFQSQFARSNIGVSIADLAQLKQKLDESAEQFIMRFKRIRTRCHTTLPEAEYVKIAIDGRQLVREMSSLKIERSATARQSSSAKLSGRSFWIQDNNVHADKGKNMAGPTEQPIISYKEMLRREPQKINPESDEDNTICERCNHILAKCFFRTKKEDDYKPLEVEEPKSVPRSIENSRPDPRHDSQHEQPKMARSRQDPQHEQPRMARPRHDLQNEQPKMAQSNPGSQFEQPRMAQSKLVSRYEQPRVVRSRFGSHYKQPRMARYRLGPQYEQPKMVWSRPNPHYILDSRFESVRKPRMMRPLVSKVGRWVTLETPGLKPIHKQEYKNGYNPYFSRITRTQRQRWIRQQAALHQEYGQGDHHSSRSTTDSDSMEVITGAKAPEYLRGPYVGEDGIAGTITKNVATPVKNGTGHKLQDSKMESHPSRDSTKTQNNHKRLEKNNENVKSETESEEAKTLPVLVEPKRGQMVQVCPSKDVEDINGIEGIEGIEDVNDIENMEDVEDIENIEDIDTFENFEDIKVEETDDMGEMEEAETLESGIQTGELETESEEPKNGKTLSCYAITLPKEFVATTWVQKEEDTREAIPILLAKEEECQDTAEKRLEQNSQFAECNIQPKNGQGVMGQEQISTHPIRMDDIKEEVQDPLVEVNLGTKEDPRVTFETSGTLIANQGRISAISTTSKKNGSKHHPKNKGGD
uniref:Retrotransposon gag domain-containing protein n=1 Tax=Fagus sylvatica TaxID=28930 RepID=A0A2N9END3_FAGSY